VLGVASVVGHWAEVTSFVAAKGFLESNLDHPPFDVLPFVPRDWLDDAFQRLAACDMDLALRQKIVPISWIPTKTMYAVVTPLALVEADSAGLKIVARIRPEDYRAAVKNRLGPGIRDAAVKSLARQFPTLSAHQRLTAWQAAILAALVLMLTLIFAFGNPETGLAILSCVASLGFALVVLLRLFCLVPVKDVYDEHVRALLRDELPTYTVLVPLFREVAVLDQLIGALKGLRYPEDKLDIKIILEEEDVVMQRALSDHDLPPCFDVIVVPNGKPQTKPRALNYALRFARGKIVTIYDSEDLPQPQQLLLAAARFAALPESVACLQAALVFYNSEENWLTRHFTAEYAALFKVILPALAVHSLPLPLGGTSNHFRMGALKAVGGWDPYNVTEDADLGIRLARFGYSTDVIRSDTFEEANTAFLNWMKQRRRWLKGFLQTWLVHMRSPVGLMKSLGLPGFLVMQCMTIGVFASALLHPILLICSFWSLHPDNLRIAFEHPVTALLAVSNITFLALGYLVGAATSVVGLMHLRRPVALTTLLTLPIYWLMMSAAAWMALWDFLIRPFHWHKTQHGLSRHLKKKTAAR
jgi:glycosyltransferase XagB